jgi:cytidylate kinase
MKYLDTGAMYRAVTYEAMLRKLDLDDQNEITLMAQECDLHVGIDRVIINGQPRQFGGQRSRAMSARLHLIRMFELK